MKSSNLAQRLEEFAATVSLIDVPEFKAPPTLAVVPERPRPAPRRSSLDSHRIQIRDQGLRPFRVF
jgi:hypothetical protein